MGISLKTLLILCFSASSLFGEATLNYPVGSKANVATEVLTDLEMKVGDKDILHAKGSEVVKMSLEVVSDPADTTKKPFTISYTLLDYVSILEQGDTRARFSIDDPKTDFLYGELRSLRNKPTLLVFNNEEKGFEPLEEHDIYAEMLKSKKVADLLLNRLREVFFLHGKELEIGKTYENTLLFGQMGDQKGKLSFKITSITAHDVDADIQFILPRQRVQDPIIRVASGMATGKGTFSRSNALNFSIEMTGHFGSSMQLPSKEAESQDYDLTVKIYGTPV